MSTVQEMRESLVSIKHLLGEFLRGTIDIGQFMPRFNAMFASFDPPDITAAELGSAEQKELEVFIMLMGGWFSEDEHLIPRRKDWECGEDLEPYSWIDADAYREWIVWVCSNAGVALPEHPRSRE
ncbi:MAG: hypothetical protein AAF735_04580 [Myxococcota bacterium]